MRSMQLPSLKVLDMQYSNHVGNKMMTRKMAMKVTSLTLGQVSEIY